MLIKLICVSNFEYSRSLFAKKHRLEKGDIVLAEICEKKIRIKLIPEPLSNEAPETKHIWTKPIRISTIMYHFEIVSKKLNDNQKIFKGLKYHN